MCYGLHSHFITSAADFLKTDCASEFSGCDQTYMYHPYANQIMNIELTLRKQNLACTAIHCPMLDNHSMLHFDSFCALLREQVQLLT